MPAVKTGMTPPPMPGMPAPMQPMGGMPPAPNPFAPMPPMPLAGMPPPPVPPMPPMAQGQMPQGQQQQMQGATAGRRRRFGDALEGMLGRNQGLGAAMPQPQRAMPPQMMPQQRMVAPGTPMMRTPPMQSMMPRPMEMGGEVDIFGYADGGMVQYMEDGGEITSGITQARDSAGDVVPGMFVARYSDGTYSKPVTASNIEGLRQGIISGRVTSGDYTADEASSMAAKDVYLRSGDVAVTDRDVSGGFGSPLGMSGEMLGNDMVFVRFNDGTTVNAQKGMVDAMNEYGLLEGMGTRDDFTKVMQEISAASVRDPESDLASASRLANDKIIAYNEALRASDPNIQKNIDAFRGYYAPSAAADSVSSITGAESGAGSAVGAGGNFGTGVYTPSPVDPSEINPIDYSQFTGDVGSTTGGYDVVDPETGVVTAGSRSQAALFGPRINIPQSVSQYMTDPVTGGLTTSYGPELVATSPIGAIKLPARPVDIDIFDFLSTPTYGTMYSGIDAGDVDLYEYGGVNNMRMGGEVSGPFGGSSVPREAMIADQPHMLAYINQDEEALLRSFGGSGIAGPGGIPSYPPGTTGYGSGEGTGYGSSISATRDRLKDMAKSDDDDSSSIDDVFGTGNIFTETSPGASTVNFGTNTSSGDDSGDDEDYTPTSAELAAQLAAQGLTNITPAPLSVEDQVAQYDLFGDDFFTQIPVAPSGTSSEGFISGGYEMFNPARGEDIPDVSAVKADLEADQAAADVMESAINLGVLDDTILGPGEGGLSAPVNLPSAVVNAPVVYTDRRGNQYDSQAAADAADRAFGAQLMSYGAGKEGFDSFADQVSKPYIPREESDRAASRIYTDNFRPELAQYRGPDILGGIYSDIEAIGGLPPLGDTRGGVSGVQPITSLNDPEAPMGYAQPLPAVSQYGIDDNILDLNISRAGRNLDADMDPFDRDRVTNVPLTDDDMGLPSGPVSDLERGLGGADYYGGSGTRDERDMYQAPEESVIAKTIAGFEDRTETPYWDVNANRAGYGSDTKTNPETGEVTKITSDTNVSKAEADADLNRRLTTEFIPRVVNAVGEDTFYGMNPQQQAALTSIAYNYGNLPTRIEAVINNVDASTAQGQKAISDAIRSLEGDNDGVNRDRRNAEADLFLGQGNVPETSVVTKSDTGVSPEKRDENAEKIKQQIGDQAEPTGIESIFYDVIGGLGFGLGKDLADKLRGSSRENRQAIIDQHVYALQNGATPKTDEDGNYIGFDISTMDTFADKVLGAEDIMAFMPPSSGTYNNPAYQADADGDGVSDYDRFQQVFGAQSTAASADPTGTSTEQGFITSDGKEFFVDAGGNVVEVTDGTVPFEVGGGEDVIKVLGGTDETITGGDDNSEEIKNYTTDEDGNKVCNDAGYVYNSETDTCELPAEEEKSDTVSSPSRIGIPSYRSFNDLMASITTPAPKIAPISANIRPMQDGGMAGLNRTADNFLKALAG